MKRTLWIFVILILVFTGCSKNKVEEVPDVQTKEPEKEVATEPKEEAPPQEEVIDYSKYPQAVITMHTGETMTFALMPEYAPNTVNNFIELSEKGFYNGLIFHRVIETFMIQGGDPMGNGTGGPGYRIEGEFADNGYIQNTLSHNRGVLSMARSADFDSAGSQFFICHQNATHLDNQYAAFGVLIDGEKTLDRIAKTPTGKDDVPTSPEQIKSITITRNGYEFAEVKKIVDRDTKALDVEIAKNLPFGLETPVKDVVEQWGEYSSYDYLLGGLYYKYDEKGVIFFSNGYTTDNGVELGNVLGVAYFDNATFLNVSMGTAFDEVIKVLGEPTSLVSPESNQDSELYGGGWTLNYETENYVLTLSSIGDEKVVDGIYIFKK